MLSSENKKLTQTCWNLKYFLSEDSSRNSLPKIEKINSGRLSAKVVHNQIDRTHCKKRSATVIQNCR